MLFWQLYQDVKLIIGLLPYRSRVLETEKLCCECHGVGVVLVDGF